MIYVLTTVYVEIFRGTPLLVQILIVYFALPTIGFQFSPFVAGIIALSLNSAAYQAEIFRGGVQSISSGQMEAARSMGLTYNQSMLNVIIPQGLRNAIPPYTNEFIILIKDSSLVSAIGLFELTYTSQTIIARTGQAFVLLIFIAAVYFIMTFTTSTIMKRIEKKYAIPGMMGGN
ncbi:MAG: amino acid ABC transporter permease [Desulfobacterales bacterium]|nr:amino acid ABC transporter permease [Desulfobacterales bacterium]